VNAAAYVRVSSRAQDYRSQVAALSKAARARGDKLVAWYHEKQSASKLKRPELERLRADARAGDVRRLYVFKLDRLARSGVRDMLDVVHELEGNGVVLVPVADPFDYKPGPVRDLVLAIYGAVAAMEREASGERVAAGLAAARARGVKFGRPRRVDTATAAKVRALRARGKNVREIAVALKIPKSTVQRVP
jgi:DNA invertase Pin-like site-specific DNA recombinase